jgi:hypothetical protein
VGILEGAEHDEERIELRPPDRLVFYTDGISEAENEAGEMLGEERLGAMLANLRPRLTARETVERVLESVRGFLAGTEAGADGPARPRGCPRRRRPGTRPGRAPGQAHAELRPFRSLRAPTVHHTATTVHPIEPVSTLPTAVA